MIWFLTILCLVLIAALGVSLFYLYKFANVVIAIEDVIEDCTDTLDSCYFNVGQILEIPVGSDDPFVKSVISEIRRSQQAILVVANKITEGWRPGKKETNDGNQ